MGRLKDAPCRMPTAPQPQLVRALAAPLDICLPSIEQIEAELRRMEEDGCRVRLRLTRIP